MLRFLRSRSEFSDEELLAKFRESGQLTFLGQLYTRYAELVYGVCLKYLGEEAAAEDAGMAIFEELVKKVPTHEIRVFRSWLYVLTKNHCLMQLRRQKREPIISLEPEFMHLEELGHPIAEEASEAGREAGLRDCLESLNEQQRRCIELFYFEGKSYKDIAEQESEDLGKVRSHIQNGRRNLRLCLEEKERKTQE